ncbi:MAG: hypothetical protein EKK55_08755 [Rhodocyclaceae bacterium]|nr:MAG: hypothetical protein EKK55_08755 [Rhodocyclaceae bacterium]
MRTLCRVLAVLFTLALVLLPALACAACNSPPGQPGGVLTEPTADELKQDVLVMLRELGDTFVRIEGTAWLREKMPEMVAVLDADKDGEVSIEEISVLEAEVFSRRRVMQVIAAATAAQIRKRS